MSVIEMEVSFFILLTCKYKALRVYVMCSSCTLLMMLELDSRRLYNLYSNITLVTYI